MKKEYINPAVMKIYTMEPFCLDKTSNPDPDDPILAPRRNENALDLYPNDDKLWDDEE